MSYARIIGTGSCLPERALTNAELEEMVDTTDEWIRARTGITQRHVAAAHETTSVLAEGAARQALEMAGLGAADLDLIIVGTTTPDQLFPNTGVLLQQRLGIGGIPAFSLEAVCSGFIYALAVADAFVRSGDAGRVLVVGAETFTHLVDWTDRGTCVLFGDGAGAVVLEASGKPGILGSRIHADGRYKELLCYPSGIARNLRRVHEDGVQMKGNEVFKVAVNTLSDTVDEILTEHGLSSSDVDWLVPHQANIRILQATARKLGMSMERVIVTVDRHGNTSAASIPLALDVAVRDGRIQPGDLLLLEAFGGGFTWGSALVRF